MNRTLKTIVLTALSTTLFWIVVVACYLRWGGTQVGPDSWLGFEARTGSLGVVWLGNTGSQQVVAVVENFGTQSNNYVPLREPLLRQNLRPGEHLRVGVRTLPEEKQQK
jgi:hypothetical protein